MGIETVLTDLLYQKAQIRHTCWKDKPPESAFSNTWAALLDSVLIQTSNPTASRRAQRSNISEVKLMCWFYLKITDKNYIRFLSNWKKENKPHVLLFDHMPVVPLLYKVM